MIESNNIHVAISPWDLTDDYNRHAGVTLVSLLEHCTQPITIHILYDKKLCIGKEKETDYNKTCYQKIADKYNCKLLYHHVELPEWINQLVNLQAFTPGTLLRLNIPEILQDINKIIYLDCDTIVLTDIVNLWHVNLDGKYLGGVLGTQMYYGPKWKSDLPHPMNKSMYDYYLKRKINISESFNAGVLVLNLSELRKLSFTEKAYEYLKNNLDAPCPDQDALNYLCQNNFVKLDWKYNGDRRHYNELKNDCILHLINKKPWKKYYDTVDDIYWEYLRNTPWCEDIHVFYTYLRDAPDISKALSELEHNFFANLSGTKMEKAHYAFTFLLHIAKSIIK